VRGSERPLTSLDFHEGPSDLTKPAEKFTDLLG
jgi:hypothetical protein